MHALLLPERVSLHMLFPAQKHDVGALRVDVQIAVPGADGTVAVGDLLRRERGGEHFVSNGAAVAVGCVPDFGSGGRGGWHGKEID